VFGERGVALPFMLPKQQSQRLQIGHGVVVGIQLVIRSRSCCTLASSVAL
jgi:hypothetical protein